VKHWPEYEDRLRAWLGDLGIVIPEAAFGPVVDHVLWVLSENERLNLTAIREPFEALRLHAVDSLVALHEVDMAPLGSLVDIGTGAGFPGLPLAIASGRTTVLVDSVQKKSKAVQAYVVDAGLYPQVSAIASRAEDLGRERPGEFAVVTLRAVSELPAIVELSSPLLGDSGILVALKARIEQAELDRGRRVGEMVGLEFAGARSVALPGGGETRTIVQFRRVGASSISLPRRIGMAQKRPLA